MTTVEPGGGTVPYGMGTGLACELDLCIPEELHVG
jgi:hypothetical protein